MRHIEHSWKNDFAVIVSVDANKVCNSKYIRGQCWTDICYVGYISDRFALVFDFKYCGYKCRQNVFLYANIMVQNDAINFDLSFLHTQMQFVSGDKIDTNYVVDELIITRRNDESRSDF